MNYADCLPEEIADMVKSLHGVRELRLRNGKGVKLNIDGRWFWLGEKSLLSSPERALKFTDICDDFVKSACNRSVYAYEKMLSQGFFTLSDGSRIGVCGVMSAGGVFQKYTSLCVRTAQYFDCAKTDFDDSVIVAGAPSSGKTTYLRDLACKLSENYNVVVVDERGEIASCNGFEQRSECDVFRFAGKRYAFEVAVRTMSPDWIVCDELGSVDLSLIPEVTSSGVKLAASVHASDMDELRQRLGESLNCFSYAVMLARNTFSQKVVNLRSQASTSQNCVNSSQNVPENAQLLRKTANCRIL